MSDSRRLVWASEGKGRIKAEDRKYCALCERSFVASTESCPYDGSRLSVRVQQGEILFSHYRSLGVIGKGGMGVIYKAEHLLMNKVVAVKMMLSNRLKDEDILRFQREVKAASKLDHPNIIRVLDFGLTDSGTPFMVTEFIDGITLSELIEKNGALALKDVNEIALQLCSAMQHAHEHGIIHRDLKPSNLMIVSKKDGGYSIKVVDFGIAKVVQPNPQLNVTLTKTGDIIGSPAYMSPEQAQGQKPDHRTDIYSAGCIIYEMLTGVAPIQGGTVIETILKQINETPLSLKEASLGKKFSNSLEALVAKCLKKTPEERFESFRDLAEALEASAEGRFSRKEMPATTSKNNSLNFSIFAFPTLVFAAILLICMQFKASQEPSSLDNEIDRLKKTVESKVAVRSSETASKDSIPLEDAFSGNLPSDAAIAFIRGSAKESPHTVDLSDLRLLTTPMLEEIAKHSEIHTLILRRTQVGDKIFDYIKKLPLRDLDLSDSGVTDAGLRNLGGMKTLLSLNFSGIGRTNRNAKAGLTPATMTKICELDSLRSLKMAETKLSDGQFEPIAKLIRLTDLDIAMNPGLTDKCLRFLEPLQSLSRLNESGNSGIKPESLFKLKNFSRLRDLNMSHNEGVDDRTVAKLFAANPFLETLDLSATNITDKSALILSKFSKLTNLHLKECPGLSKAAVINLASSLPGCEVDSEWLDSKPPHR